MVSVLGYAVSEYLLYMGLSYSLMAMLFIEYLFLSIVDFAKWIEFWSICGLIVFIFVLMNFGEIRIAGVGFWNGIMVSLFVINLKRFNKAWRFIRGKE